VLARIPECGHRLAPTRGSVGEQPPGLAVGGTNGSEMAPVQGDDGIGVQALRQDEDRCVGATQREVTVLFHQPGDLLVVVGRRDHIQIG